MYFLYVTVGREGSKSSSISTGGAARVNCESVTKSKDIFHEQGLGEMKALRCLQPPAGWRGGREGKALHHPSPLHERAALPAHCSLRDIRCN